MSDGFNARGAAGVFPQELMSGFASMYNTLRSANWADPDGTARRLFEEIAKYDFQATYSKFMATCVLFWLAPEQVRRGKIAPNQEEQIKLSEDTERAFDVLWLAYERWMARGLDHYAEVATALSKFYTQLRWGMALQRTPGGIPADVEKTIAEEAYHYLVQVRSLVERSYSLFESEIEPMLDKLIEINPNIQRHADRTTKA